MKILCKLFGHFMFFDSDDISGPSTCKWCGHKEPAIEWDYPPMPEVKPSPRYCMRQEYREFNHTHNDQTITSLRLWVFRYSDGDIESVKRVVSMPDRHRKN